jgi:hypothetical protein
MLKLLICSYIYLYWGSNAPSADGSTFDYYTYTYA